MPIVLGIVLPAILTPFGISIRSDTIEHLLARDAERLQLPVRDRALDHRCGHAELDERLDIGLNGAREAPHLGPETGSRDELDRAPVVGGDTGSASISARSMRAGE